MKDRRPISAEAARLRMADLCARSEQCEADIRQKLYRLGLPASSISEIVNYLIDNQFVDNNRFAKSFARDKCRFSAWGRYKIQTALAAKRIPSSDISEAIQSIERSDYMKALRRTAEAKARGLDLFGEEKRENRLKLYRHIMSRGFESNLASGIVKTILREMNENSSDK